MKESCQDREGYLAMLSGFETLSDLYIHKPVPWFGPLRNLVSGKVPGSLLKPVYNLVRPEATPMKSPAGDLKLDKLNTWERSPYYFSDEEIAVYTVLFGPGDKIQDPLVSPDNIHYFIITDQKLREQSLWQKKDVDGLLPAEIRGDSVLCNRWCKMHPERLFPDYKVSVYIDANILVTSDLTPLIAGLDQFPLTMFRHWFRNCVYQEIQACLAQKKASRKMLMMDKDRLERLGIPKHWGLLEAPVIARRHNDPLCCRIMDEWWEAFCKSASRRDQIALMDCLWKLQIRPEQIGILGFNVRATRLFIQMSHIESGKKSSRKKQ